jgi:hypothetical protein
MMKKILVFATLILLSELMLSQILDGQFYVPPYPVPELYYGENAPVLPEKVLNYKLPYFPQRFYDQGSVPSCGQASAVYYCLTYEYNRLKNTTADSSSTFAPLYTYFFLDFGDNWYGASSFDSWNIIKNQGNPFIIDLNEILIEENDGLTRLPLWMNGYDKYYRAMNNRISGYYSLDVSTEVGLKILQHYLNDHLIQEQYGGTAILYGYPDAFSCRTDSVLDGWYVTAAKSLSNDFSHSMAIVGYYANTRFDFNNDGIISDSIDLNNDGVIDFHDNEKILWIIANSSDNTSSQFETTSLFVFKYDLLSYCFNGQVFLPVPDTAYQPSLTTKVEITHPLRGLIKVSAGISSNLDSEIPEHTIDFPIFDFQGGLLPMQGDDTVSNPETIEFGLDISPLLKFVESDKTAKLFLMIDNASIINGSIGNFSVISYDSGTPVEYVASITDTLLPSKSCSQFSVNMPLNSNFDENILRIESDSLYIINETLTSFTITALGGTPPYQFFKYRDNEYQQEISNSTYEIDYIGNSTLLYDSLLVSNWPVSFAGEIFDTLIIGKKGGIFFGKEEPIYSAVYPYFKPESVPLEDMEIVNYYPSTYNYSRRIRLSDTCLFIYNISGAFIKTEIYSNGKIRLGYTTAGSDWHHSSYIRTRSKTYYSALLPYSYQSEYKSTTFYPILDTSGITINVNGNITIDNYLAPGEYSIYAIVVDSIGNKATKMINLEVPNLIPTTKKISDLNVYPNPASREVFIDFDINYKDNLNIEIFNLLGESVYSLKYEAIPGGNTVPITFNESQFPNGLYFGHIKSRNLTSSFKFVVLR